MSSGLIELTGEDGIVYVNPTCIALVRSSNSRAKFLGVIHFGTGDVERIRVMETPDEIVARIGAARDGQVEDVIAALVTRGLDAVIERAHEEQSDVKQD